MKSLSSTGTLFFRTVLRKALSFLILIGAKTKKPPCKHSAALTNETSKNLFLKAVKLLLLVSLRLVEQLVIHRHVVLQNCASQDVFVFDSDWCKKEKAAL
jgi:hypothetical protein